MKIKLVYFEYVPEKSLAYRATIQKYEDVGETVTGGWRTSLEGAIESAVGVLLRGEEVPEPKV